MSKQAYVLCVSNEAYEASLVVRRLYPVVSDPEAEADGMLRVIDESGEDYLFPATLFVPIEVPDSAEAALAASS